MENVTKIDIIGQEIASYNEETDERVIYPLVGVDTFMNEFSDTQELLTVNVTSPKARIVKFYEITESIPERFEIIDYSDMTTVQKGLFDEFVNHIKAL